MLPWLFASLRGYRIGWLPRRFRRRPDAGRDCDSRAAGDRPAGGDAARDRPLRLCRRLPRLRRLRRQPLHVGGGGFHHRADLRRRAGILGRRRHPALCRAGHAARADGRRHSGRRRLAAGRLARDLAFDPRDDGLSRGHRHPHHGGRASDAARHIRGARAASAAPLSHPRPRGGGQSLYPRARRRRADRDLGRGQDQREGSGRADRRGRRRRRRGAVPPRYPRRESARPAPRRAAASRASVVARSARHRSASTAGPHRRHGLHHANIRGREHLSFGGRSAGRCQPRLCRRRGRQHRGRLDRLVPRRCESAQHRHRASNPAAARRSPRSLLSPS